MGGRRAAADYRRHSPAMEEGHRTLGLNRAVRRRPIVPLATGACREHPPLPI